MAGTLYLVATPIGNLEDMTFRAVRILKEVDEIAAEDTRNSVKLLNHFDIHTPMTSYHEFNRYDKAKVLVGHMLEGKSVAVITDAGTPGISDPGEVLVQEALSVGISVVPVPGACAAVNALIASGQATRRFSFEAFLPREKKERKKVLMELQREMRTMVIYEAPHHLKETLKDLLDTLGDRSITLCKELTKKHENFRLCRISEALDMFSEEEPRGEYVLVIAGKPEEELEAEQRKSWEDLSFTEHLAVFTEQGMSEKDAMKAVARERGIGKSEVYREVLAEREKA